MNFFSLHSHTTYSFLDGLGQPKQYVARLDEIGQAGMAITDHGNVYAHHPFSNAFKKANKHLVYGVELYCVEKLVNERGYYHLTVLAKTNEGYQNLLKLMNIAYSEGHFYYKPRVSFAEVLQNSRGLIILSGCCCDSYLIKQEDQSKVNKLIMDFKQTEFYIELQPFIDEKLKWDKLIELSKKYSIDCLVTLDSHYVRREDKNCHYFQLAINTRKPLSDPDRLKMEYPLYLATADEVVERCKLMGEYDTRWIEDTFKVALSCNVTLPKTEMLKLGITIDQIREKCLVKMQKYGLDTKPEYMSRLEYELVLINDKGFNDYFWIIQDMMSWARERMLVGAGRGSSAGSLVCWMLGITEVDPIKNELYFERFLDIERKDAPDIDLDFPTSSREQMIEYVRQKYGDEKTSQMITFSTFAPRGVIQDSARVLGIPIWETKIATEQIVERFSGDERAELCLLDSVHGYEKLKSLYDKYPKLYESIPLEGQVKQIGKHAAGLILGNVDLKTIGFVNREGVFSIDKYHIENVGLLKIDVLGIETLDIIQDVCKEVSFDFNNLYTINLEDPIVYEKVFAAGKVLGIFQFEGAAVKNVNRSLKPRCFNHLVHIIALARPGSLHSGQTTKYIERFNGTHYEIDKNLKPYTADTLGILIFQEQIMAIVRNIGNFSWEDTGKIRRAISKNAGEEYMMSFLSKFVEGSKRLGIEKERAEQLYKSISSFGGYSFNKCLDGEETIYWGASSKKAKRPTIAKMYKIKNNKKYAIKTGHKSLNKKYNTMGYGSALSLCSDGKLRKNKIIDIYFSGFLPLYKVTLEDGKTIKCTLNHSFPTPEGVKKLSSIKIGDNLYVKGEYEKTKTKYNFYNKLKYKKNIPKKGQQGFQKNENGKSVLFKKFRGKCQREKRSCEICEKVYLGRHEVHHIDFNRKNNKSSNLIFLCFSCHKKQHYKNGRVKQYEKGISFLERKIVSIKYAGRKKCYDVEMKSPNHNFLTEGGIITSNSHAVSYAILSFWVAFLKAYFPEQFYARILKNEIDEQRIKSVLKEYGKKIIPWDINRSQKYFTSAIDENTGESALIGGLTNIKGTGDKAAEKIINARPFSSYEDFKKRMPKGVVKHFDSAVKYDIVTTLYDTYKNKIQTMKLSRPIVSCEEILEKGRDGEEFIMLAKVVGVNPKDHNEAEKVAKRGYKMKAPTEFVVLKVIDDSDNVYIVCFDRFFTERNKPELLALKEKICLFRVKKSGEGIMIGVKFKILDQ